MASRFKLIVLDDDPTGSQTVHGCPLLLRWNYGSLRRGLTSPSPLVFILTNTRALDPEAAEERIREICVSLRKVLTELTRSGLIEHWSILSRGDSTLRGHFPLELVQIDSALGPFDATLFVPAFLEAARTTRDGVHLLMGKPMHSTHFARDRLFGYSTSYLPDWVIEKSKGKIPASSIEMLTVSELEGSPRLLRNKLASFSNRKLAIVDAESHRHLEALGEAIRDVTDPSKTHRPRRFLYQSAASLINVLIPIKAKPYEDVCLKTLRRTDPLGQPKPILVMVGSHVPIADLQIAALLADQRCCGIEIDVPYYHELYNANDQRLTSYESSLCMALESSLKNNQTPVLFTSRGEYQCSAMNHQRKLGQSIALLMARLAAHLAHDLGLIICKGGTTTQALLLNGLGLDYVELCGQVMPGLSVVIAPVDSSHSELPIVTFPGNLGDADGLVKAFQMA